MAQVKKDQTAILYRFSELYIGLMISVFLLFPGTGGYENITEQKASVFFLLSGIYALGVPILRTEISLVGNYPLPALKEGLRNLGWGRSLILVYWLMTALSTLLSDYRSVAFWGEARHEGFVTITLYCICFLWISCFAKPKEWMLWLFAVAICVNDILALLQIAGYNPLHLYPEGLDYYDAFKLYSGQFLGTVGNVDMMSAVFTVAIPLFWISLVKLKGNRRFLLVIPLALTLGVLLIAFVEGGVLGVFAGALLTVPVIVNKGNTRKALACSVAMILILGVCFVYFAGDRIGGFVSEAHQIMHGNWDDSFGSGRIYIWRKSLELVNGHLLFGGGPETMIFRTDAVFERLDEELGVLIRSYVDTAHNEYLNVLVNQGLLALLPYLGALLWAAVQWVKIAPENAGAAVCGGAVLSYCIQAFFGISSLLSAPYFWLALGLLISCLQTSKNHCERGGRIK